MSRERQRTRAAREAARAAEREADARQRARQQRLRRLRPSAVVGALPSPRRRARRYGALPPRVLLGLALGWLLAQFVAWQLVATPAARLGIALVCLAALPLVVVLLDPRGRSR